MALEQIIESVAGDVIAIRLDFDGIDLTGVPVTLEVTRADCTTFTRLGTLLAVTLVPLSSSLEFQLLAGDALEGVHGMQFLIDPPGIDESRLPADRKIKWDVREA